MNKIKVVSEIEITVHMIGGKYKSLILYYLITNGTKRFNELLNYIEHISQKTLTNQLRELEAADLVTRVVYPEIPPKVEYSVTEKGRSLYPILEMMCDWGEKNIGERYEVTNPQCR